ncbi:MAG: hypothetical protein V7637_6386 [Mycobacteriales bacterium]
MTDEATFGYRPQGVDTTALRTLAHEARREFSVDLDAMSAFAATGRLDDPDAAPKPGTSEFEKTVAELVRRGMAEEALGRVERRLGRDPDDSTLLYLRCDLLLVLGRHVDAAAGVHGALEVVDRRSRDRFHLLLEKIIWLEGEKNLGEIRRLLRRGELSAAVQVLDGCSPDLTAVARFADLDAYVRERLARQPRSWRLPGRRPAEVEPLPDARLQPLLYWLLREELDDGIGALNQSRYAAVRQAMTTAEAIDDRCSLIAFVHALALYAGARDSYDPGRPSQVAPFLADLARAGEYARRAAADPDWREMATEMGQRSAQAHETLIHNELVHATNLVVTRFNGLVDGYLRRPISTESELYAARRAMSQLGLEVSALRRRAPAADETAATLGTLDSAITRIRGQLRG